MIVGVGVAVASLMVMMVVVMVLSSELFCEFALLGLACFLLPTRFALLLQFLPADAGSSRTADEEQAEGAGEHHKDTHIDSWQPRVADDFEDAVLGLCATFHIVAILIDFPSVEFHGLVDVDRGGVFLSVAGEDLYLRGEAARRTIGIFLKDEVLELDTHRQLHGSHLIVNALPLRLALIGHESHSVHVRISECGTEQGDEKTDVVQQERYIVAPAATGGGVVMFLVAEHMAEATDDNQPQKEFDVCIDEHEGPERQHIAEPATIACLSRQAHDDGESYGINQSGYCGAMRGKKMQGIVILPNDGGDADNQQEGRQDEKVDRPDKSRPVDRTDQQFQKQTYHDEASANDEALFHCPRFIPHGELFLV